MNHSFTLYPGWAQRHSTIRLWHAEQFDDVEILVQEDGEADQIFARVTEDEFSHITRVNADYRMRKLVRLLSHRILESLGADPEANTCDGTNAPDNIAGCTESKIRAIDKYVAEL